MSQQTKYHAQIPSFRHPLLKGKKGQYKEVVKDIKSG
jgi:hypothetical protein